MDDVQHPRAPPSVLDSINELSEGLVILVNVEFLLEAMFEEEFDEIEFPRFLGSNDQDIEVVHLRLLSVGKGERVIHRILLPQKVLLKHSHSSVAVVVRLVFPLVFFALFSRIRLLLGEEAKLLVFLEVLVNGKQGILARFTVTLGRVLLLLLLGVVTFRLRKYLLLVDVGREYFVLLLLLLSLLQKRGQNRYFRLVHVPEDLLFLLRLLQGDFLFLHFNYIFYYQSR